MMQVIYKLIKNAVTQKSGDVKSVIRMANSQLSTFNFQLLLAALLLTACTKADIHYPLQSATDGYVIIEPDQRTLSIPAQSYHFYNMDGATPPEVLVCDGQGNFRGKLLVGTYLVLASNTGAGYTDFRGMDSYETAVVYDTSLNGYTLPSRSISEAVMGCDSVYSIRVEVLDVTAGDTVWHTPVPECLTKSVTLTFTITGNIRNQITSLTGTLYGIYPSAHLYYCSTPDEDIAQSPGVHINFTTTAADDDKPYIRKTCRFNLFGLCNPNGGDTYTNLMPLTVTVNNTEYDFEIDLTDNLTEILKHYNGVIPLEIPLNIELNLNDMQITAEVKSWDNSGDSEVPVPF